MCLYNLTEQPATTPEIGWKVFDVDKLGRCKGACAYSTGNFREYPTNEWITDHCDFTLATSLEYVLENIHAHIQNYQTGFHIFLKKEDAEAYSKLFNMTGEPVRYVVKQVKFNNVVAWGKQRINPCFMAVVTAPCVVAREMFIMEKAEEKCA